jgi:hypothetical protein
MKKIALLVTNVWEYTNGKSGEKFVKLQLVKDMPAKEINGCEVKQKLVLYFTCASTKLAVGEEFVYDPAIMATFEREFEREDGTKGRQLNIRMLSDLD